MSTPGASSSASGFSSIGFHLSVPGIRPCAGADSDQGPVSLRVYMKRGMRTETYEDGHARARGAPHDEQERDDDADRDPNLDVPYDGEEEGAFAELADVGEGVVVADPGMHSARLVSLTIGKNSSGRTYESTSYSRMCKRFRWRTS